MIGILSNYLGLPIPNSYPVYKRNVSAHMFDRIYEILVHSFGMNHTDGLKDKLFDVSVYMLHYLVLQPCDLSESKALNEKVLHIFYSHIYGESGIEMLNLP